MIFQELGDLWGKGIYLLEHLTSKRRKGHISVGICDIKRRPTRPAIQALLSLLEMAVGIALNLMPPVGLRLLKLLPDSHLCLWMVTFVCGQPSSFFGWSWWWCSCWYLWVVMKGGGGDKHGWWCGGKKRVAMFGENDLPNKHCLLSITNK